MTEKPVAPPSRWTSTRDVAWLLCAMGLMQMNQGAPSCQASVDAGWRQ